MLLSLDNQDSKPLVLQIVDGVQRLVDQRMLRQGARLPSIRQFAQEHRVSRFTVVQAYDRLVAAGTLDSRRGSGFYVARPIATSNHAAPGVRLDLAMDTLWLVHRSMAEYSSRYMPGCGWLPASWQDSAGLARSLRGMARSNPMALLEGYGSASGYPPLRQDIQQHLHGIGIHAELEQIITTHGVVTAIDLLGRYLLQPGDVVLVDDPGYFHSFGQLQTMGAEIIGVRRGRQGPDTEMLAELAQRHRPKFFLTTSVLHNPTGLSISQSCAYRVLRLAEEHDFYILEDDIYGFFNPHPSTRLATLDQLNRVIYLNGFSKTITPKLRVGYMVAPRAFVHDLLDLKLMTGLASSELAEKLTHQILLEGYYRKHLGQVRDRLQRAREHTMSQLERSGLRLYAEPEFGMFVSARFEHIEDATPLAAQAAAQDILLAPGSIFRPHQQPSPWLRFNVAYCDQAAIFDFLQRAAEEHARHETAQD
ncbi:MAG: PLP-dependent aminotransferase family protein [Candidatus Competibacteraceae bacterium]|nr:PLP-dependent aminotransferase family protein [Candidatus Competibacteraceae bacterium]MCB1811326.1 PLP-dependent aminotransferase family protein [Candidatus Competibacteraceae bacterium]